MFSYIYFDMPLQSRTMPYLKVNRVVQETEKAICLEIGYNKTEKLWFPKSIINKAKQDENGNPVLPKWFKFKGKNYERFCNVVSAVPC